MESFKPTKIIDIQKIKSNIISNHESPLENSVRVANYRFINKINSSSKILEIGCGCNSYLKNIMTNKENWHGIDIQKIDSRGRKSIASKIGSVQSIPYSDQYFDYVISNQSIEHWHEYGVNIDDGINEINRVLKKNGELIINFPFFLHGHPDFVRGNIKKIKNFFSIFNWEINSIIFYYDSNNKNYKGWRLCGFPDFYIKRYSSCNTSFVVEFYVKKIQSCFIKRRNLKINFKKKSQLYLVSLHGFDVLLWKIYRKIKNYVFKRI